MPRSGLTVGEKQMKWQGGGEGRGPEWGRWGAVAGLCGWRGVGRWVRWSSAGAREGAGDVHDGSVPGAVRAVVLL